MLPIDLEKAMFGVVATPVLHLADRTGVLDHLIGHGSASAAKIAGALGLDEETLDRMLLVLVSFGVVRRTVTGEYLVPAEAAPYVDRADPRYIGGFVTHLVEETARQMTRLPAYLERGKAVVDQDRPAPFATLFRDGDATRRFMSAMWDLSYGPSRELAVLADLDGLEHLVDVGGACGPFAVAALERAPRLRATVFDLPVAERYLAERRAEHGLEDRLTFTAGDFFADDLPEGDLLAFGYIFSDWTDEICAKLLEKAYRACRPGGRVLVMERLFDDSSDGPLATSVMNLTMHMETCGRHRTAGEYIALLTSAGFTRCEVRRSGGAKHLVLAHKGV
ncbi:methyltransferase [Streptosporangium sp. NPDC002721]|uniref:methyltransferase n=1 Tax=Streptosporangium sp. NPDC002721 TaxID=3366188 RepID=UPI0036A4363E